MLPSRQCACTTPPPPCLARCPQVPQGSTPRTLMVHLRGSLTRSLKAGGSVTLSGIFLPEPYTGQRAMLRASLLTSTYMEVMAVKQNKQSYQEMNLSDEQRAAIEAMTEEGDIYSRLASSIAPGQRSPPPPPPGTPARQCGTRDRIPCAARLFGSASGDPRCVRVLVGSQRLAAAATQASRPAR